jgi:hypothetical protein
MELLDFYELRGSGSLRLFSSGRTRPAFAVSFLVMAVWFVRSVTVQKRGLLSRNRADWIPGYDPFAALFSIAPTN